MKPYYERGGVVIHQGNCLDVLPTLPAESVHTCVTSPPYWGLRDYGTQAQLGLESMPEEYVANMVAVFREVRRVLRDDGTLWLNLGDSYCGGGGYAPDAPCNQRRAEGRSWGAMNAFSRREGEARKKARPGYTPPGLKPKDLVGIPWRVAFALQADGWYLRSDIIWAKPNPMPESATDRPTRSHEYLFLLSKSDRYHFDADAVKEKGERGPHTRDRASTFKKAGQTEGADNGRKAGHSDRGSPTIELDGTRNIRSVWPIATQPFPGAHFAVMPRKLVEPCIKAGCPAGGTVLDPFMGAGTVAYVARELGCKSIGVELNPDYIAIAAKRMAQDVFHFAEAEE